MKRLQCRKPSISSAKQCYDDDYGRACVTLMSRLMLAMSAALDDTTTVPTGGCRLLRMAQRDVALDVVRDVLCDDSADGVCRCRSDVCDVARLCSTNMRTRDRAQAPLTHTCTYTTKVVHS